VESGVEGGWRVTHNGMEAAHVCAGSAVDIAAGAGRRVVRT
jgi:hypothetical protein